jgi:hypothetical protein
VCARGEAGRLKQAFESRLALRVNGRVQVLPFSQRKAAEWQVWRSHDPLDIDFDIGGQDVPVGQDTRMVIATAFGYLHLNQRPGIGQEKLRDLDCADKDTSVALTAPADTRFEALQENQSERQKLDWIVSPVRL